MGDRRKTVTSPKLLPSFSRLPEWVVANDFVELSDTNDIRNAWRLWFGQVACECICQYTIDGFDRRPEHEFIAQVRSISWARRAQYLPIYCRFYRIFGMTRNRGNTARPPVTGAEVLLNQ